MRIMALFQKKPQVISAPLYTLGTGKTVLVVGLGNPGKKYEGTRHNIGFACIDSFAKIHEFDAWIDKKNLKSLIASKLMGNTKVILAKPQTYMNSSGEAVQAIMRFYRISSNDLIVVHDELDIPFGQIRIRNGGSSAGHNGIKSLIGHIGEQFGRVRVGIGSPDKIGPIDYVLSKFTKDEQNHILSLERETTSILTEVIYRGELQSETRSFVL